MKEHADSLKLKKECLERRIEKFGNEKRHCNFVTINTLSLRILKRIFESNLKKDLK